MSETYAGLTVFADSVDGHFLQSVLREMKSNGQLPASARLQRQNGI